MLDLFKLLFTAGMVYTLFFVLRERYFKQLTIMILAISIFGSGYIYFAGLSKVVSKKVEGVKESVYGVEKSIDKLSETIDGVGNTFDKVQKNPIVKGTKKATDTLDNVDKVIKDKGFKLREKITGREAERLEE